MHLALNDIKRTGRIKPVAKKRVNGQDIAVIRSFQKNLFNSNPQLKAVVSQLVKSI